MAREVTIQYFCDRCLADDQRTLGEELPPFLLPGLRGRPRLITLCEVHRKEFYEPLLDLLRDHGQQVANDGQAPRSQRAEPEPSGPTDGTIIRRRTRGRKFSPALYAEVFQVTRKGKRFWDCDECSFSLPTESKSSLNNFGSHYRRMHEVHLGTLLEERLGPDRMARLVSGIGGVLRDAKGG